MLTSTDSYVAKCISCAKHKGTTKDPVPMLQQPPPKSPWDVVAKDLIQLSKNRLGSPYLLACVDHFSRFVVLAPVENKTVACVTHVLVTQLICLYIMPRILLSDNGAEFRNGILAEFCNQYNTQNFISAYHPASNGWSNVPTEKFSTHCVQR